MRAAKVVADGLFADLAGSALTGSVVLAHISGVVMHYPWKTQNAGPVEDDIFGVPLPWARLDAMRAMPSPFCSSAVTAVMES